MKQLLINIIAMTLGLIATIIMNKYMPYHLVLICYLFPILQLYILIKNNKRREKGE